MPAIKKSANTPQARKSAAKSGSKKKAEPSVEELLNNMEIDNSAPAAPVSYEA